MELCEQGTLEDWIQNNRQNRKYHKMAQTKFLQILTGVEHIHSKGLIHRDLKVSRIGNLKKIDKNSTYWNFKVLNCSSPCLVYYVP